MAKKIPRVAVVVRGGNVVNVVSDTPVEVYILDYDNGTFTGHEDQKFGPFVDTKMLKREFDEWDEQAKINQEPFFRASDG